jgi:RecB family exonuclease
MDVETIYQVPLELQKQKFDEVVLKELALPVNQDSDLKDWKNFLRNIKILRKSRNCFSREVCFSSRFLQIYCRSLYTRRCSKKPK